MQLRATIDFESRSECSIRNCGTWKYSLDPTTEVLCLGFRLPYWPEGETGLWHPAFPHLGIEETSGTELSELAELFEWITDGGLVEAHNSFFEKAIWTNQCLRLGFPPLPQSQIRCSAAKAASHALPRALDDAIDALDLPIRKDTVRFISALYRWWTDGDMESHRSHLAMHEGPDFDQQLRIPVSDFRQAIAKLDAIGYRTSEYLEKAAWDHTLQCGSWEKLRALTVEEIAELTTRTDKGEARRIGMPRAIRIKKALR